MLYHIWSYRHSKWWGPNRAGYTDVHQQAGIYSKCEAQDIVFDSLPGQNVAVDLTLAERHPDIEEAIQVWRKL